jgi:hypothetical protein
MRHGYLVKNKPKQITKSNSQSTQYQKKKKKKLEPIEITCQTYDPGHKTETT